MPHSPLIAVVVTAGLLAGCSLSRPMPPVSYYGIEPGSPVRVAAEVQRPESLRIGQVRVAASYAGAELVYRIDEVRFVNDFYHRLMAPPGAMLGNAIAVWLDAAGPMRSVAAPGAAVPSRYVLDLTVNALYGDFRPARTPQAVLRLQATLLDTASANSSALLERTIERSVTLPAASPEALVLGYSRALNEVLTELQPELARALR
ncbi:MAG: ABC-type transport auxiliary lipoprotein family protein [Burkholderiaceae bacterium]